MTIFCIGRNYGEHAAELHHPVPEEPIVFLKPSSALCASGQKVILPKQSQQVAHEVEVVVRLGRGGKRIPESDALKHVSGYAVGLDLTARDIQNAAKQKGLPWTVAKGFDTFAPISEFVAPEMLPDQAAIAFDLSVNGILRQKGNTAHMIFTLPKLIAYLSQIFTLAEGDLIFTGTPQGVGSIQAGDRLIARLGEGLAILELSVERAGE